MLKKRSSVKLSVFLIIVLAGFKLNAQTANQLAQKMDLENGIKNRVSVAVEKVLGHQNFVVNIKAEVEFLPDRKIEEIYKPGEKQRKIKKEPAAPSSSVDREMPPGVDGFSDETAAEADEGTDIDFGDIIPPIPLASPTKGLRILDDKADTSDLPGIAGRREGVTLPGMKSPEYDLQDESEELLYSRSVSRIQSNVPRIRHLDISIFLPDGISPDLLESVRQVTRLASQFDRDRGDVINIMTTAFKGYGKLADAQLPDLQNVRYEKSTEEKDQAEDTRRMIEEIQRQLDNIERDRMINTGSAKDGEPSATENMMMKIIDKLTTKQGYEDEIEARRIISEQNARIKMLAKDTSQLAKLNEEIAVLKAQIAAQGSGDSAREADAREKIREKRQLEDAIADKIAMLNASKGELEEIEESSTPPWIYVVLGVLLLAVIGLAYALFKSRGTVAPAPMADKSVPAGSQKAEKNPAVSENELKKKIMAEIQQDLEKESLILKTRGGQATPVRDDELQDVRENIVNLSVANPDAASKLMKRWVNDADDGTDAAEDGEVEEETKENE